MSTPGARTRRLSTALVVVEIGLALVLLANVFVNARAGLAEDPRVFALDPEGLVTARISLPAEAYLSTESRTAFYQALRDRVSALPDVTNTALTSALPLGGGVRLELEVASRPTSPLPTVYAVHIAPDYFETLAVPLLRGRDFTTQDGLPGQNAVIVNERFAATFLDGIDALGQQVRLRQQGAGADAPWATIVGVSPTVRQVPAPDPQPIVYRPLASDTPSTVALIVRPSRPDAQVADAVREVAATIDDDVPLYSITPLPDAMMQARWNARMSSTMANGISIVALLLALVGIHALTAHVVANRTAEIGVRMALGARPWQVRWLVLRRLAVQLGLGILLGLVLTLASGPLFGELGDPVALAGTIAFIGGTALLAALPPLRRALRVDPSLALRAE